MRKPEVRIEELIAALKSGKYEKGKENLVDEQGKRCCLGVLCELVPGATLVPLGEDNTLPGYRYKEDPWVMAGFLTDELLEDISWMDLSVQEDLITLNDNSDDWSEVISYLENL